MKTIYLLVATSLSLVLISACAQSPTDGSSADANTERVVCVREPDMGSRLGKRVCSTKAEREAAAAITREEIRNKETAGAATGGTQPAGLGN